MSDARSREEAQRGPDGAHRAGATAELGASPLDRSVIEQLRSLQQPGQPDVLRELVEVYMQDAPESLHRLRDALHRRDAKLVYETAHRLKSSSASLGARKLTSICEKLELTGRSGALEGAFEVLDAASAEFGAVCRALQAESGSADPGEANVA